MRGQAAFEFIVLIALAMLLLMVLIIIGTALGTTKLEEQRDKAFYDFGNSLQQEILLSTTVHPGYEKDITIPDSISRFNFEITTQTNSFTITSAEKDYTFRTPELTGTFTKGQNTIRYDGSVSII